MSGVQAVRRQNWLMPLKSVESRYPPAMPAFPIRADKGLLLLLGFASASFGIRLFIGAFARWPEGPPLR